MSDPSQDPLRSATSLLLDLGLPDVDGTEVIQQVREWSIVLIFVLSAKEIHLTPIEYKLLTTLIRYAGKVMTHRRFLKEVWGPLRPYRASLSLAHIIHDGSSRKRVPRNMFRV